MTDSLKGTANGSAALLYIYPDYFLPWLCCQVFTDVISSGWRLPCTNVNVVVELKQNSRCLSTHLPSPLSLSTPHDSKFSKLAPLPGLHIDRLGLRTSLQDHTGW